MLPPDAILRQAFDQAALPLALVDDRASLSTWNPAFESLFRGLAGVGPERLAMPLYDFLAGREGARLGSFAAEILRGSRKSASVESPIRAADGTSRWLALSLSRVELPSPEGPPERESIGEGTPEGTREGTREGGGPERFLLLVADDITERVLREQGLRDARDEAEKATLTKSQFLANMSHEIRTPIQTILGVVELLRETELDTEQSDYVNQVRFSADVLLGLINDILDFSKIEAGRLELETTNFDLRSWVHRSVDLLAMEANRKGLEIIVDVDRALPALVSGDPGRLRQIIVNLFKNAVKFTREGGITLSLLRVGSSPEARMRFEVADTGSGIPESTRERLFTPFFQGDLVQARKTGGTGLGLAISRHLVELMGGSIGVKSADESKGVEGETGSVFWFELPLDAPDRSTAPSTDASGTAKPAGRSPRAMGSRLLVVDDYPPARAFAGKSAMAAGYRVSEAGSGEEALGALHAAVAARDPFALCLIDQNMPRMDGWRLASEITGDIAINDVRLILMAPVGSIGGDAKMKLLRWFNGYISKPIKPGELLDALDRALSSEVDLEGAEAEIVPAPNPAANRFTGAVLLAEDHEVNRELFTMLLSKMGCGVVTAKDGVEAVEIGVARRFDLVLMDIFMPRMSGYDAARALRDKGYSGPIIAVTASALKGERENCIAAGMNDILVKPFKKEDLAAVLAAYLPLADSRDPDTGKAAGAAPERSVDSSVFDWNGALETFLGQETTVRNLLRRFIEKARGQMDDLSEALRSKDLGRFMEVSHSLKGASWNLCAKRLGDAALRGEAAGREADLAAASPAFESIRAEFAEFVEAASIFAEV